MKRTSSRTITTPSTATITNPIGALQGLAPEHVIDAGSASKMLAPSLRLGWLVLPRALVADVAIAKLGADRGSPTLEQRALAAFLDAGDLDRHLAAHTTRVPAAA